MNIIPTIIEKTNNGERVYDIYSRLLKDRIIFIGGEITDDLANAIISELLFLDSQNNDEISIYKYILIKLAIYYDTSVDYLLELTDERKPYPRKKP